MLKSLLNNYKINFNAVLYPCLARNLNLDKTKQESPYHTLPCTEAITGCKVIHAGNTNAACPIFPDTRTRYPKKVRLLYSNCCEWGTAEFLSLQVQLL